MKSMRNAATYWDSQITSVALLKVVKLFRLTASSAKDQLCICQVHITAKTKQPVNENAAYSFY